MLQGSIRQNLDIGREFTDRDMIRVLKDVRLWEILCGISLSHAKEEEESPRLSSSQQQGPPQDSGPRHTGCKAVHKGRFVCRATLVLSHTGSHVPGSCRASETAVQTKLESSCW